MFRFPHFTRSAVSVVALAVSLCAGLVGCETVEEGQICDVPNKYICPSNASEVLRCSYSGSAGEHVWQTYDDCGDSVCTLSNDGFNYTCD